MTVNWACKKVYMRRVYEQRAEKKICEEGKIQRNSRRIHRSLHRDAGTTIPVIPEGAKVRLDVEKIKAGKNYVRMNPEYKEFVESSEGVTFTAHVEEGCFVSLKENPKWLFWSGDLSRVEDV